MNSGHNAIAITTDISIPMEEVEVYSVRAAGPGGQNVNKVATSVHLRFNIMQSSLPEQLRTRLLALRDRRVSSEGVVVIKAQRYRSRERNLDDAYTRLQALVRLAMIEEKRRHPTQPTRGAHERRLAKKTAHGKTKALRQRLMPPDD